MATLKELREMLEVEEEKVRDRYEKSLEAKRLVSKLVTEHVNAASSVATLRSLIAKAEMWDEI